MLVVVDSREQLPFTFQGKHYEGATVEQGTLYVGDYSIKGFEQRVSVERKSLPDLIQSISHGRERFEKELQRGQALDAFVVVCEGGMRELAQGQYRSRMNPKAAFESITSFELRYGVSFKFCESVALAEWYTYSFLSKYLAHRFAEIRALVEASGLPVESLKIRKPRDTV